MIQRRTATTGLVYYASPLLEEIGIPHAFSTRIGGVSPPPFDSLNFGNPSGWAQEDDDLRIQENYRRLQQAIHCQKCSRCWVHQIHGCTVEDAGGVNFRNGLKGDALVTTQPAQVLAIRIADCVPVLIASTDGKIVAAIHAGWRGVISGVIPAAVRKIQESTPQNGTSLIAAVGPCIGFNAFEVGAEVLREFNRTFGTDAPIRSLANGKGQVDLAQSCRVQLIRSGVRADCIDMTDRCTFSNADEFFSHRRDNGITGRMAALIAPRSR